MSFVVVLLALALLMFVAYRGFSVILFAPVFASLIPQMIVPYADAAALMLANLDRGAPPEELAMLTYLTVYLCLSFGIAPIIGAVIHFGGK